MAGYEIETVFLDLDDTLWEVGPSILRAEASHYAWLEDFAPTITARYSMQDVRELRFEFAGRHPEIAHDFTRLRLEALSELLSDFGYDASVAPDAVSQFVDERSRVELFHDVEPCLEQLSRSYRLVAVTNGNANLEIAGVHDYFSHCISPAESGVQKPDPQMFEVAMSKVGASAERCIHVGDHPVHDIQGARLAGIPAVWLNRSQAAWPVELEAPAATITTLHDLHEAIDKL